VFDARVRQTLRREAHRPFTAERWSKAAVIAQKLAVHRTTVRASLAQAAWLPYRRAVATDTHLTDHRAFLD